MITARITPATDPDLALVLLAGAFPDLDWDVEEQAGEWLVTGKGHSGDEDDAFHEITHQKGHHHEAYDVIEDVKRGS